MKTKPTLAILNTSNELIEVLEIAFQDQGFNTVSMATPDFKTGKVTVPQLIKKYQPDVILYDVAIPYEENWNFFQKLSQKFHQIPVVITTTNKGVLESLVGPTNAFEIIGKPYDLFKLVELIRSKLRNERINTPAQLYNKPQ